MEHNTNRRRYPYPKSRVYLSTIIAVASSVLALLVLTRYPLELVLYYFLSTIIITISIFLLKIRLYLRITEETPETEGEQPQGSRISWRMLILTLGMVLIFMLVPILLAAVLPGPSWFILMLSYMTGVSAAEICTYLNAR